ncbi:hypothetical protein FisN_1Lh594 [Fistulifera solaris]|uniref:J domain-containing protein n=1 Tax=Fistulifera solaris TaxID=1519565 RepID=A0A1Z5K0W8_FISSO|nr:hypothetical protein FisN_1Lh594 [Fistulifera solaris]|eukprot:GAX19935.1 hypothetical protein FisN_1Lh594 [Fistulifera solaris]
MNYFASIFLLLLCSHEAVAFHVTSPSASASTTSLWAGMGMATKNKKSGTVKKTPYDVNASLLRLGKKYDELLLNNAKTLRKETDDDDDLMTSEYVIAARAGSIVPDWIPVAQLVLARSEEDSVLPIAAASYYCRELSQLAIQGSRVFQSVPRNLMEYSVEPADSFYKYVYDAVIDAKSVAMTTAQAREILGVAHDDDDAAIKHKYRRLSFDYHPDRAADKEEEYGRVQLAYETIGMRRMSQGHSWYASLGGRARTDFVGPIELMSIEKAENTLKASNVLLQSAVCGLNPSMVQSFVARSQSMLTR